MIEGSTEEAIPSVIILIHHVTRLLHHSHIVLIKLSDPPVQDHPLLSSPSTNPSLSRSKPCIGCPGAPPLRWGFAKGCLFVIYIQITSIVFKALIKAICSFWNCSLFPFGRSGWVSFASLLKLSMFSIRYKSHHKVIWVMLWMDQVLNLAVTSSRVRISSLGMPRISRSPGSIKTSPLS